MKAKDILKFLHCITMLVVFVCVCAFAEAGKFLAAFIAEAVFALMAAPLNRMFPSENKKEDMV